MWNAVRAVEGEPSHKESDPRVSVSYSGTGRAHLIDKSESEWRH